MLMSADMHLLWWHSALHYGSSASFSCTRFHTHSPPASNAHTISPASCVHALSLTATLARLHSTVADPQVRSHFETFVEDQFDFHSYCLRKGVLRSYIKMIRCAERTGHAHRYVASRGVRHCSLRASAVV
jgi:NMDA receptor-regulated protein 1